MSEFGRPALNRRRKRRFRPLRRLLLLLLVAGLMYGVFSCSRYVYHTVFPELRLQRAVLANEPLLAGQAVVLRDEVVVAAERAGVLNKLRSHGSRLAAGEIMFEIVDVNRLAAIDRQLADEAQRMSSSQAQSPEVITHLRAQLATAQASVRDLAARYAYYLRTGDSAAVVRTFAQLQAAHRTAQANREQHTFAARSQEQFVARREELQSQRRQAVLSVTSPTSGVINFALDGWENELGTGEYRSLPLATVRQISKNARTLENMDVIEAGQVVGSVVDPRRVVLLLEAGTTALGGGVDVVYGETVLAGSVLAATNEGGLVALRVLDPPVSLLTSRIVRVSVRPQGEVLTKIPLRAVLTHDAGKTVYVQTGSGELQERVISVRDSRAGVAVVTGLSADELVVVNPKAIRAKRSPQ